MLSRDLSPKEILSFYSKNEKNLYFNDLKTVVLAKILFGLSDSIDELIYDKEFLSLTEN